MMKLYILHHILYGQDTINNKEIVNNKDKYKSEDANNRPRIKYVD